MDLLGHGQEPAAIKLGKQSKNVVSESDAEATIVHESRLGEADRADI